MSNEAAFALANALVFPQWLLMLVAPRWRVTQWLMQMLLIPTLLAVLYGYYLFTSTGGQLDMTTFSTLKGVMTLFREGGERVMLAGWIHYLAFDLVAGSWLLRDGQQRNIAHGWLIPCLLLCFMLGPLGLLLYTLIRTLRSNDVPESATTR